jgi:hypothetical protein
MGRVTDSFREELKTKYYFSIKIFKKLAAYETI